MKILADQGLKTPPTSQKKHHFNLRRKRKYCMVSAGLLLAASELLSTSPDLLPTIPNLLLNDVIKKLKPNEHHQLKTKTTIQIQQHKTPFTYQAECYTILKEL